MGSFTSIVVPDGIDIHHLYMDESGELGTADGSSKFFLVTLLSTASPKALKKRIWKKKAELYNLGWPKDIEIKGTTLWGADHIPRIPDRIADNRIDHLNAMIDTIVAGPVAIHYSIARKKNLYDHVLNAPYGVAFNFLSGTLLVRAYPHFNGPISLTVDQRNKETHHKLKFDGYVETKLVTECEHSHPLEIRHCESHDEFGLQAVDFMSWGLYRWFEHRDSQFADRIEPVVSYVDAWYPKVRCPGI